MLSPARRSCSPLLVAGLAALAMAQGGCSEPPPKAAPAPNAAPAASARAVPEILAPPPPLGRGELLAAVAAAASAHAAGGPDAPQALDLAGQRFTLRLPFGCGGPSEAALAYAHDPGKGTLKVTARPEIWTDEPWVRSLVGSEQTEAIEGFWVRRPWLSTEACPSAKPSANGPAPETVGLAQVFQAGDSRLLRRGERPYEVTRKIDQTPSTAQGGFRLVLEGRVAEDRPVRCRVEHADVRPVCLVKVALDRVALEDRDGQMLGDWRS